MKNELIIGGVGAALGAAGTATQTNEVLQGVSLVITIIGAIISFIVVPLINVWRSANKDGKIDADEARKLINTAAEGAKKVVDAAEEAKKGNEKDNG